MLKEENVFVPNTKLIKYKNVQKQKSRLLAAAEGKLKHKKLMVEWQLICRVPKTLHPKWRAKRWRKMLNRCEIPSN